MEGWGDNNESNNTKKTMEETFYWNYFQTVRFCVQLPCDFKTHLMIPKKFTENIKKRLPDKLVLRGPCADSHNWEVELNTSINTTSIIGEGWKEFITAYNLKENDTLVFKYKNNACFKVLVFEAQSCGVEKESSYFIKKPIVPTSNDHNDSRQEKVANLRKEISSHDSDVLIERNEGRDQNPKRRVDTREPMFEYVSIDVLSSEDLEEEMEGVNPKRKIDDPEWAPVKKLRGKNRDNITHLENVVEEIIDPLEIIRRPSREPLVWPKRVRNAQQGALLLHNSPQTHETPSRKRKPTNWEKQRAQRLAFQELPEESFYLVMSPSHVSKTFRMGLPKEWTNKYMAASNQDVILRVKGNETKEWRVRYNFDQARFVGKFISGWVYFARDNGLHEFDVCVFTLAGQKGGKACLDVKIVRAIEDQVDECPSSDNISGQHMRSSAPDVVVGRDDNGSRTLPKLYRTLPLF